MTRFLELGPDAVLAGMAGLTLDDTEATVIAAQRKGRDDIESFVGFLADAHTAGVAVDWNAFYAGRGAHRVDLPTYAFQHERYWLDARPADGLAAGRLGHPILTAAVPLAREDAWLFTGRFSLPTHPWVGHHVSFDRVVVPSVTMVELLARAATEVGLDTVEELTLEAPILPPDEGEVELQVLVEGSDEAGQRPFTVHFRMPGQDDWSRHASGSLGARSVEPTPVADARESVTADAWPPEGADAVDVDAVLDRITEASGLVYGPAFVGVRGVWRTGDGVFSEVALGDEFMADASGFALHPALFDMALHAGFAQYALAQDVPAGQGRLLFRWAGARVWPTGATSLRVRSAPSGPDGFSVAAFDDAGRPVLSVEAIVFRTFEVAQLAATSQSRSDALLRVEWVPVADAEPRVDAEPGRLAVLGGIEVADADRFADVAALRSALAGDAPVPDVVLAGAGPRGGDDTALAARAAVGDALALLQDWLADERMVGTRLVVATRGAVAAGEDEVPDLATAAVWGLVRSAQSEHPGRIVLVDADADEVARPALSAVLAGGEPQVALRDGRVLVPRLAKLPAATVPAESPVGGAFGPGTVVVTGGTGGLGALVARHLVRVHGVRHLVLVSRRGADAPGAADLVAELEGLGAEARVVACDVTDRAGLGAVLASVPVGCPVTGVVHAAGVLDDATIESLGVEQVDRVFVAEGRCGVGAR